jgi:hypothetical protein
MRTIAIILGDNDFSHTFMPLLEGLYDVFEYHEPYNWSQDNVKLVICHSIMAYYVGYQYRFENVYTEGIDTEEHYLEHISKYLKDIHILFDEEAEQDIASKDHDGGAWYLELQSGTVSRY